MAKNQEKSHMRKRKMKLKKYLVRICLSVTLFSAVLFGTCNTALAYTDEEKQMAKDWLAANGYSPDMAGAEQAYQDYLNGKWGDPNGGNAAAEEEAARAKAEAEAAAKAQAEAEAAAAEEAARLEAEAAAKAEAEAKAKAEAEAKAKAEAEAAEKAKKEAEEAEKAKKEAEEAEKAKKEAEEAEKAKKEAEEAASQPEQTENPEAADLQETTAKNRILPVIIVIAVLAVGVIAAGFFIKRKNRKTTE